MPIKKVLFSLSIVGFAISVFLAYQYSRPEPMLCVTSSNSCDLVKNSPYSYLFGIRLPFLGAIYFLFLAVYLYLRGMEKYAKSPDILLFGIILTGLFFETTYTCVQIFVIEALCFWCLSIELIILVMAVVSGLSLMGELKDTSEKL